jgi:hypothetical protein
MHKVKKGNGVILILKSFLTKAVLKIKFRLQTSYRTKVGTELTHLNNFNK